MEHAVVVVIARGGLRGGLTRARSYVVVVVVVAPLEVALTIQNYKTTSYIICAARFGLDRAESRTNACDDFASVEAPTPNERMMRDGTVTGSPSPLL